MTSSVSFNAKAVIPPDVLIQELDQDAVLLNISSGRYFGLDQVGNQMWKVLTTSASLQQAFDALSAEYEVEQETLRRDLNDLVDKLVENGLLEIRELALE